MKILIVKYLFVKYNTYKKLHNKKNNTLIRAYLLIKKESTFCRSILLGICNNSKYLKCPTIKMINNENVFFSVLIYAEYFSKRHILLCLCNFDTIMFYGKCENCF